MAKLDSAGLPIWSTYLGGSDLDLGLAIATDGSGNIFAAGSTWSGGWVSGGFKTNLSGPVDGFVVKLSPAGAHLWSTYVGGFGNCVEDGAGIAVDSDGNVLVCGSTCSPGWVSGGFNTNLNGMWDAFVVKLNSSGEHLWSTYINQGGDDAGRDVAVDDAENVLITGRTFSRADEGTVFVTKVNSSGAHVWSTLLGGAELGEAYGVATDRAGNVFVAGCTASNAWVNGGPDTSYNGGLFDAFVAKLSSGGQHLWSTYVGGNARDDGLSLAVDHIGNVLLAGFTSSEGWVSGGFDTSYSGAGDGFVAKVRDGLALGTSALNGSVVAVGGRGALSGATVQISGAGSSTTDTRGEFHFSGLAPGTVSVTVSNAGYYPVTRAVNLQAGETKYETFQLTALPAGGANTPQALEVTSPNGKHFIPGMPGNLTFEAEVAWNGTPGTVRFQVAGTWYPAAVTDLGGGRARATISIPLPAAIPNYSELTLEVANGEGRTFFVKPGVHFHPIPGIVVSWYGDNLPWTQTGEHLAHSTEFVVHWIDLQVPVLNWAMHVFGGLKFDVGYDPLAGTFKGSLVGVGKGDVRVPLPDVEFFGELRVDVGGALSVAFAGADPPALTPSWMMSARGKAGMGFPVAALLNGVPGGTIVLQVPFLGDGLRVAQLRVFIILGGSLSGQFADWQLGSCLGMTSVNGSLTAGVEGRAVLDFKKLIGVPMEGGIYVGGTGTPEFELCPTNRLTAVTLRGYVGIFATSFLFQYRNELGVEWRFEPGAQRPEVAGARLLSSLAADSWQPAGRSLLRCGEPNQLATGQPRNALKFKWPSPKNLAGETAVEMLVQNVSQSASPSVVADARETMVLFALHDALKPWYAATDIGTLRQTNGEPWPLGRIVDDLAAEFTPGIVQANSDTFFAAWTRVSGDISSATNPAQVLPHLEVVAARFDRNTGKLSAPEQVTANAVVDRDPLPVVFGATQGIVWIQNEGDAAIGDSTHGDRLLFAKWSGGAWEAAQAIWSAQQGILSFAFAADGVGEGHAVFAVDQDGTLETRTDRELYALSTVNGVWQAAVRLTSDEVEDALPTLVAPQGMPTCVWSAGGKLTYTALRAWNPKPLFSEETLANEAPTLDGVTLPGGAAVAYSVQMPTGVDVFAAFYDAGLDRWSLPRQLTHDEHMESALALDFDGAELVIAYLKTQTVRAGVDVEINGQKQHLENVPQPGRTDLYVLRHALGNDPAVEPESVVVEPANPVPGASATLKATIENRGDLPLQGVRVAFYDGDPAKGGVSIGEVQTIADVLVGGAKREVSVPWTVPSDAKPHDLFVVADPALTIEDRDRSNNVSVKRTLLPDLTIETCWNEPVSSTTVVLVARLVNAGTAATGPFDIAWRLGAVDGPEVGKSRLESLAPGQVYEVAYQWDTGGRLDLGDYAAVFAVADAGGVVEEIDETNNAYPQTVRVIPSWVPRIVELKVLDTGKATLAFTATSGDAAAFAVESTESLASPIQWAAEAGAVITAPAPGRFEVELPLRGGVRFYRILVAP
ncbi:MAG: SBBP repeat-containing protein [Verrucomicrobia bacterium]|nr:SBBP repeat-containing protein [Verrucomicrobiota bacterium]